MPPKKDAKGQVLQFFYIRMINPIIQAFLKMMSPLNLVSPSKQEINHQNV